MRPKARRCQIVPDEFAIVLDYTPTGNPYDKHSFHRTSPVAQGIGTRYFSLVEIIPSRGQALLIGERVAIASAPDRPGLKVFDRLLYEDLTTIAKENLVKFLPKIIEEKERVFVEFFNVAEAINIRMHSLELLPGIGKKTLSLILEERRKSPFTSFEDIKKRVKISDPVKLFIDRIIIELQRTEKYYLFVEPYPPSADHKFLNYLELLYSRVGYSEPW
jgi:putative nucleotide binding protein